MPALQAENGKEIPTQQQKKRSLTIWITHAVQHEYYHGSITIKQVLLQWSSPGTWPGMPNKCRQQVETAAAATYNSSSDNSKHSRSSRISRHSKQPISNSQLLHGSCLDV